MTCYGFLTHLAIYSIYHEIISFKKAYIYHTTLNFCFIFPSLICKWMRSISNLWPSQRRTVTLSNYGAEYKYMRKQMVGFLIKFHGRRIKIAKVNLIRVAKSLISFNILRAISPQVTPQLMSHRFLWAEL